MACVLVPATEAIVVTLAEKAIKAEETADSVRIPLKRKLRWLSNMLWGGSVLLIFEHIWHGEIVPFFPFLTGAMNPADTAEMLREMAANGVGMAVLVTGVWAVMVAVVNQKQKKEEKA